MNLWVRHKAHLRANWHWWKSLSGGGACGIVGYPQIGIIEVTGMAERDMCYSLTLCVKFLGWSGAVVMLGSVSWMHILNQARRSKMIPTRALVNLNETAHFVVQNYYEWSLWLNSRVNIERRWPTRLSAEPTFSEWIWEAYMSIG